MPKNGEYVRFKKYDTELKSSFLFYADFESILVSQDNAKHNLVESYRNLESDTNKYQKHVA